MSISGFIARTKTKALNMTEARRNAVHSEQVRRTEELGVKNAILKADMVQRENLKKAEAENKRLRMKKFKSHLPNFGGGSPTGKAKVKTGFSSPFAGGFGGNSPFKPENLRKDSFGHDKTAGGNVVGGKSPFQNIYNTDKPRSAPKKKRSKDIVVRITR